MRHDQLVQQSVQNAAMPKAAVSHHSASDLVPLRGLGPASVKMLASVGVTSAEQLRREDLYLLYQRIKARNPRASINLLYALMGAVDDTDWRSIARERRTEVLMRLDDLGLL